MPRLRTGWVEYALLDHHLHFQEKNKEGEGRRGRRKKEVDEIDRWRTRVTAN
jgi:hypothetical protein